MSNDPHRRSLVPLARRATVLVAATVVAAGWSASIETTSAAAGVVDDYQGEVADALMRPYRGTNTPPLPDQQPRVGYNITTEEKKGTIPRPVRSAIERLRDRFALRPPVEWLTRLGGLVVAGYEAGKLGWRIGTALRPIFYTQRFPPADPPGGSTYTATALTPVKKGEVIHGWPGGEARAPADGWVQQWRVMDPHGIVTAVSTNSLATDMRCAQQFPGVQALPGGGRRRVDRTVLV